MLLSLVLALLDDAADDRARRAALHEVARRLEPRERVLGLTLWEVLVEFAAKIDFSLKHGEEGRVVLRSGFEVPKILAQEALRTAWRAIEGDLGAFRMLATGVSGGRSLSWRSVLPRAAHPWPLDKLLVLPVQDADAFLRSSQEGVPFTPRVRTGFEPLLRIALHAWGENSRWDPIVLGNRFDGDDTRVRLHNHLRSARDWVAATHPDLTGMTWDQVEAASQAWHRRFIGVGYRQPLAPGLIVLRWPDGWTFQRLTEKRDLAGEGTSMGHCVGGPERENGRRDGESEYWQAVRDDEGCIFSLRDAEGVPHATVETDAHRDVVQVQGPNDEDLEPDVQIRLRNALHRLRVWERQEEIPRLGRMRVQSDEAIRGGDEWAAIEGYMQDIWEDPDRAAWQLAEELSRYGESLSGRLGDVIRPESGPPWLPPGTTPFPGAILYTENNESEQDTSRILLPLRSPKVPSRFQFLVYPVAPELGSPMVFDSLLEALREWTGVLAKPPDVRDIECFPGLPAPPVRPWLHAHVPIALARQMRAAQARSPS